MSRNYDRESQDVPEHKYAYGFDLDVMHPFMLRSFAPFFRPGSVLELGSFRGEFTRRLTAHFSDITCVEASGEALAAARAALGDVAHFMQGTFDQVTLEGAAHDAMISNPIATRATLFKIALQH